MSFQTPVWAECGNSGANYDISPGKSPNPYDAKSMKSRT